MSSHCNRYPECGCNSYCGTKCHLPDGHLDLLKIEPEFDDNSSFRSDLSSILTQDELDKRHQQHKFDDSIEYRDGFPQGMKKVRKKNTHLTPKKKKRK